MLLANIWLELKLWIIKAYNTHTHTAMRDFDSTVCFVENHTDC